MCDAVECGMYGVRCLGTGVGVGLGPQWVADRVGAACVGWAVVGCAVVLGVVGLGV